MTMPTGTDDQHIERANQRRFDYVFSDPSRAHGLQAKGLLTYSPNEGRWLARKIVRLTGLEVPRDARVLELGAGSGYVSINLAQRSRDDATQVAFLDISSAAVRLSLQVSRHHGLDGAGVQGNAMALPFVDQSFDVVIGRALMHHIPDLSNLLREAWRVTKPGGWALLFADPAPGADRYRRFKRAYARMIHRGRPSVDPEAPGETERYVRSSSEVSALMCRLGLEGEVIETGIVRPYLGFLWYPFLLKLKSARLSSVVNRSLRPLAWLDDRLLRHRFPRWNCEQWVVLRRREVHPAMPRTMGGTAPTVRKIVRVITRLNIGGPARQAALLSRALNDDGWKTVLVSGSPTEAEGDLGHLVPDSVRWIQLPALQRALHPVKDLIAWWRLFSLIRREGPDGLHTHMAKAGALGR